ncbi:hypothetical protein D0Z00_003465 [Geotrichum galactomycetum]|uniref:Uncharacterized protein n=1 Tax=Geotrichum galactomycetum TaxID=27317 RepID=A0ACB6V126_9ASCO|nr:hypothetical protein D0Z00_003465 [Geotrichum candidum]
MDVYDHIQPTSGDTGINNNSSGVAQPNSSIDKAAERLENSIETAFQKLSTTTASSKWADTTSTWASGFWSKVKQVGETTLVEAGKDLAAVRSEIDGLLASTTTGGPIDSSSNNTNIKKQEGDEKSSAESSGNRSLNGSQETLKPDNTQQQQQSNGDMLGLLSRKAQNYIDTLDRDLEVFENKAGSYLLQFGTDFKTILKDAVNVAGPTGAAATTSKNDGSSTAAAGESDVIFNVPEDIRNQIYSTRQDAQLHALHTSKEPFLLETITDPGYEKFKANFNLDKQTDVITADLKKYPKLRTLMEDLTSAKDGEKTVRFSEFWTRYYFMREQIATQEELRKKVLVGVDAEQEEELGWDDDEDDDEEQATEKKDDEQKVASSRPSSEASYDLVSNTASALDLPAKAAAAAAASADAAATTTAPASASSPAAVATASPADAKSSNDTKTPAATAKPEEESDSDDDWE